MEITTIVRFCVVGEVWLVVLLMVVLGWDGVEYGVVGVSAGWLGGV